MIDERGKIETIAEGSFKCVQLIESKKGSIRSNHFHRFGGHWLYVLKGAMRYREFDVNREDVVRVGGKHVLIPPKSLVWERELLIGEGGKIWTGPWTYHQTEFLEDTTLISCAIGPLDHDSYEEDTVRMGKDEHAQLFRC